MNVIRHIIMFSALLTLASLVATANRPTPAPVWAPDAYVNLADSLIRSGILQLQCSELDGVGRDSIVVRIEPGSDEEGFYVSSYLRSDVRVFNADPGAAVSPFLVDGCQLVGLNPYYHRISLPNARSLFWQGDVSATTSSRAVALLGPDGTEAIIEHPEGPRSPRTSGQVDLIQPFPMSGNDLFFVAQGTSGYFAGAAHTGSSLVFQDRRRTPSAPPIRVNGHVTPMGRELRLEDGDWIRFHIPNGRAATFLVDEDTRRGLLSMVQVAGANANRVRVNRSFTSVVDPLVQAMNTLAWQAGEAGLSGRRLDRVTEMDLTLSLDLHLGESLDSALLPLCAEGLGGSPDRPQAVALTVLDAFTGEVRAMPSCPSESEVNASFPRLSEQGRRQFLRNQNLVPHPIGSAGKPFWAAAVATTFPGFLDMELEPMLAPRSDVLLGCALPVGYENSVRTGNWVGFETFMERSCNRYMVTMATAAMAIDGSSVSLHQCDDPAPVSTDAMRLCLPAAPAGSPGTRLRFCDSGVTVAISGAVEGFSTLDCNQLEAVEQAFLPLPSLTGLTNVLTRREPPLETLASADALNEQYRSARFKLDVWRDVFSAVDVQGMDSRTIRVRYPFASVSPHATNLQLNTVRDLRANWISLLLGGENSNWSNVQLAESMARLLTGRAVEARFTSSVPPSGFVSSVQELAPLMDDDVLHPGVRRRVLHSMETVVTSGTGQGLSPSVRQLERALAARFPEDAFDVYVHAKTGTPFVSKLIPAQDVRVFQQLLQERNLRWDRVSARFDVPDPETPTYFNDLPEIRQEYVRSILSDIESDPDLYTWTGSGPPPQHPIFLDQNGNIRVVASSAEVTRRAAVLIVGILVVPRRSGRQASRASQDWISACSIDPSLRNRILEIPPAEQLDPTESVALTMAIHIDDLPNDEGVTSRRAVELLNQLFPQITDYVLDQVDQRNRGSLTQPRR